MLEKCNFGAYSLWNSNCQDFAERAYELIRDPSQSAKTRYPSAAIFGLIPITGTKGSS